MRSIFGVFGIGPDDNLVPLRAAAARFCGRRPQHEPDKAALWVDERPEGTRERSAILAVSGGHLVRSADGGLTVAARGHLYNHRALRRQIAKEERSPSPSDCEVIAALYRAQDLDFLGRLNGVFAFMLWDHETRRYLIARDGSGGCPLYLGHDESAHRLYVTSDLKMLLGLCEDIGLFPPSHYLDSRVGMPLRYWGRRPWTRLRTRVRPSATPRPLADGT